MLRANQAVRLGLRASSRNPELGFGKALIDQLGTLLALLPLALAGFLVFALVNRASLRGIVAGLQGLKWPTLGGLAAALVLSFAASMLFWSAALPLVAADAEMDRRPPPGNFAVLAARGFSRVLQAGMAAAALSILFAAACAAALYGALPALIFHPSPGLIAGAALVGTVAIGGSVLLDLLGRLWLIRAAAFGEGVTAAFAKAASLAGARLGACLVVSVAFLLMDLMVGAVAGTLTGVISGQAFLDPGAELLALAPRAAVGLAAAAVFGWLEVARMAALSALALDAEGLIESGAPPPPPAPLAEPVIEALPADE